MSNEKAADFFRQIGEVAAQETERKEPGASGTQPGDPASQFYVPDGERPKPQPPSEITEPQPVPGKLTKEEAEASGRTSAHLAAGSIETVFSLIERLMYLSKFSEDEKERIVAMQEKEQSQWDDKERQLNMKFLRINNKHDKIKERIPVPDKELKMMAEGLAYYSQVTGKKANPQLILVSTITKAITNRAIDIFL
ncbi:MAG TPA: hypothetical protein VEB40_01035 [Flavipsychrobacter sp.]|nr:hypothetical protein [Flavipsychrobacter sp.]